MRIFNFSPVSIDSVLFVAVFGAFALGSGSDNENSGQVDVAIESAKKNESDNALGDYEVEIKSCRISRDYEGKNVVIVKYGFTNNSDNAASFSFSIDDAVYQNNIGLTESYFLSNSADYDSDNQLKEIKPGATIDVEVAYELDDLTSNITVEVKELISFSDKVISKEFSIA